MPKYFQPFGPLGEKQQLIELKMKQKREKQLQVNVPIPGPDYSTKHMLS